MSIYKLGKRPARRDAIPLKFGTYFHSAELPVVPAVFGRPWLVQQWGILGNAEWGDCFWAGAAHETMLLRADAGLTPSTFETANVLSDYAAATGFANTEATDQGTDVAQGCAYRQQTGIVDSSGTRHKIDVYTSLRVGDLSQLALATYLFGIVGVGVQLPSDAEKQFSSGEVWDITPGQSSIGGHYIPCVGRNSQGNYLFVTWGRLQAATPRWVQQCNDESVAMFSRERLAAKGYSPQGYDQAALEADFQALTS